MITLPKLMDGSNKFENTPEITAKSIFYYVQSAGHYFCMPGYFVERNIYNSYFLLYSIDGKGSLHYRDNTYPINKGQIILINCMDKHYYSTHEKSVWETVWIHFNGSESRGYFDMIYKSNGPVINLKEHSNIPKNLKNILQMLENRDLRLDILSSSLIVDILTELLLNNLHSDSKELIIPDTIKKAITIIENSFNEPVGLDEIAKKVSVSKFHLIKLFKSYTGFSPYEYLIKYRINYAKDLLKNTGIPINTISEKVGFESVSHFVKIFRKYEDTTPLKFRMLWRK